MEKNPRNTDDLITFLSEKYNLPESVITKITRTPFKFVVDTMEVGEFQSVHLPYFGKFAVKPNRLKYYKNNIEKDD